MYRIVIVEDDPMVSLLDRTYAEKDARFQVVQMFQNGQAALEWLTENPADLVILDVYMPLLTGFELLRTLRSRQIPVDAIMVTAANDPETVDALLKMGVVDYLVKPFSFDELLARLRVVMRKRGGSATNVFTVADLTVDTASHHVTRGGRTIALSAKEFALLEYMIRNRGVVLSRERIENHLWNYDYSGGSNVVDVYMSYLRRKIDADYSTKLIHTVWGVGWVLREET